MSNYIDHSVAETTLKIVEEVCRDFDGNGIFGVGAGAALRAMARHWKDHLHDGHKPRIISEDIDEMKNQLEVMRAEVMRRVSEHAPSPIDGKMSNYIEQPVASQDKAVELKNTLGQVATAPFYIWANDDCANKTNNFNEAKAIRLTLFNEGGESVYIVDADGVEVVDAEIEAHEALANAGYFAGARKPDVKPEFPGAFMVNDPQDSEGYAIVGDDIASLILEARDHLTAHASDREVSNYIEQAPATKLVEVRLSALTRVEYMEVVEVPANITQAELDDLVNARYHQVDGGEFTSDPEYWERGTCEAVETDMPNTAPSMMAFRTAHGLHIERADAAAQTVESSGPTP